MMISVRKEKLSLYTVLLATVLGLLAWSCCDPSAAVAAGTVTIEPLKDRFRVLIDGELFTEYIFDDGRQTPILYPVIGPHGVGMTRNYPMKKGVPGESEDHPHHQSVWFAHRPINGVNFFHDFPEPGSGQCVQDRVLGTTGGSSRGEIRTANNWLTHDGKVVFTDTRTLGFQEIDGARAIDWQITIEASHGDVTIGDSKEGTMAIRLHPNLRLDRGGQAVNSEGIKGTAAWGIRPDSVYGKRAAWIDYWGEIDGKTVGVAIFDHPSNPRHPTHWMARHYGYVAANPFGLSAFEAKPPGTGDMRIAAGDKVTFRYRFLFHEGDARQGGVDRQYRRYAEEACEPRPATEAKGE